MTDISIILTLDGKVGVKTSGNGIDNAIVEIFGRNVLISAIDDIEIVKYLVNLPYEKVNINSYDRGILF